MVKAWDQIIGQAAKQFRPFNDKLIYDYRRDKIAQIPEYLDKMWSQVMEFFGGQMKYCGYRVLTPEERLDYIINNPITKGCWSIRDTETVTIQFEFEFKNKRYYSYIDVPYLINERLVYNDTEYYPMFPIVERSGVNRTENGTVIVKVMRVPITFGRRPTDKYKIISVSGTVYPELLPTVKIYQGKNSGRKGDQIPIILYHLAKFGYRAVIKKHGINPEDISLADKFDTKDKVFDYFMMPDGVRYLKVKRSVLANGYKLRIVLSLYRIFKEMTGFSTEEAIFSDDSTYYKIALGKFTSSKESGMIKLLLPNAEKHLAMTDPMLDLVAKDQLRRINCNCDDIYDLLYWMFYNIDDLLVSYEPTNLFDKKIESLDNLACYVARNIAYAQYSIINSKKAKLDFDTVERFCKRASQRPSWIAAQENERQCQIFVTNPQSYNDNYLLTVGLRRCLSLESLSSSFSKKNRKGSKNKTSPNLLKAHPSQLLVTSILDIPASSPIETGSLNPYVEIEDDGTIIKPPYADEIKNVFK